MCSPHYGWFRMQDTWREPSGSVVISPHLSCLSPDLKYRCIAWEFSAEDLQNLRDEQTAKDAAWQHYVGVISRRNTKYFHYIYYDILTSKIPAAQYLELPCKDLKGSTPRIERAWVARSPPYLYLPMIEEKRYIILPSPLVCIQNLNPITIANFYSLWY